MDTCGTPVSCLMCLIPALSIPKMGHAEKAVLLFHLFRFTPTHMPQVEPAGLTPEKALTYTEVWGTELQDTAK